MLVRYTDSGTPAIASAEERTTIEEFAQGFPMQLGQAEPANEVENPWQIDTPDELQVAEETPAKLSSDDLARELNNPNTPLAGIDYFVERSDDFGLDFGFKVSFTPVVPNVFYEWLQ